MAKEEHSHFMFEIILLHFVCVSKSSSVIQQEYSSDNPAGPKSEAGSFEECKIFESDSIIYT